MLEIIRPIETKYKGFRFRSRLEARWAVFFDVMGIEWEYEPEGFELGDGMRYLPDFYLPESNTFFEVKGRWTPYDRLKVDKFIESGHRVVVGYSNWKFQACSYYGDSTYELDKHNCSQLVECMVCGCKYFNTNADAFEHCPNCGTHLGAGFPLYGQFETDYGDAFEPHGWEWRVVSIQVTNAIRIANSMRFEWDEEE